MPDLRTRAGRTAEILAYIRKHHGFSVFWATENQTRAFALTKLIEQGKIVVEPIQYPHSRARILVRRKRFSGPLSVRCPKCGSVIGVRCFRDDTNKPHEERAAAVKKATRM